MGPSTGHFWTGQIPIRLIDIVIVIVVHSAIGVPRRVLVVVIAGQVVVVVVSVISAVSIQLRTNCSGGSIVVNAQACSGSASSGSGQNLSSRSDGRCVGVEDDVVELCYVIVELVVQT